MLPVAPVIPSHVATLLVTLGTGIHLAAFLLSGPLMWGAVALGSLLLCIGGRGWSVPAWVAHRPKLSVTLAPVFLMAAGVASSLLVAFPMLAHWGTPLVGLLSLLAGKVEVPPGRPSSEGSAKPSGPLAVPVQATPECSLEDAARGLCR